MVEMIESCQKNFVYKAGLFAKQTLVSVQKAYGNESLNRSKVLGGIFSLETEGIW
jgi:hypothetical protein